MGLFTRDKEHRWLPLQFAATCCREDICMSLLTLTGPQEDLGGWGDGNTMCHYAPGRGKMSFLKALVDRGVALDVRNDRGYTPLGFAVRECYMPAVRLVPGAGQEGAGRAA